MVKVVEHLLRGAIERFIQDSGFEELTGHFLDQFNAEGAVRPDAVNLL